MLFLGDKEEYFGDPVRKFSGPARNDWPHTTCSTDDHRDSG